MSGAAFARMAEGNLRLAEDYIKQLKSERNDLINKYNATLVENIKLIDENKRMKEALFIAYLEDDWCFLCGSKEHKDDCILRDMKE